jgi:hypothetical protein
MGYNDIIPTDDRTALPRGGPSVLAGLSAREVHVPEK